MKKIVIFALALAAVLFCSCTKEKEGTKSITEIYFTEIGFLKEFNDFLDKDYLLTDVNTKSVLDFVFDNSINPSVLSSLVMSTRMNKDAIIATLENDKVLSGKDTLDFSKPVEIRLALDDKLFAYTVNVKIAESAKWVSVAQTSPEDTLYTSVPVAYDPSNDTYYMVNQFRSKEDAKQYPVVLSYKNGEFSRAKVLENVQANSQFGIAALNGVAYVAYSDVSASTSKNITVGKYDFSAASYSVIGNRGAIDQTSSVDNPQIMPMSDANIYVGVMENLRSGAISRRALNIAQFTNGSWTQGLTVTGRNASDYGYYNCALNCADCSYLATFNQNVTTYSVYKFTSTGLTTVFESVKPVIDAAGTAAEKCGYHDIAITDNGDIYLLCNVMVGEKSYKLALQKYDAAKKALVMVGGFIPESETTSGGIFPSLAIASDGTAYAAFQNPKAVCRPMASVLDPSTLIWSNAEALSSSECKDKPVVKIDNQGAVRIFATIGGGVVAYEKK